MKHIIVYYEPGRFGGWPANGGIWIWGNEVLVCFQLGYYKESVTSHSIDQNKPIVLALARSKDGGETWELEMDSSINCVNTEEPKPIPEEGINFGHPDFSMKVGKAGVEIKGNIFTVSYDRGHNWRGPYAFYIVNKNITDITGRTDYIIEGAKSCLVFLSHKVEDIQCTAFSDRAFVIRTDDGGKSWYFIGYITEDQARSVMPSTVKTKDGRLITAIRRRLDISDGVSAYIQKNWIEVCESLDGGKSWHAISCPANTGMHNGNPPSLVLLPDNRLVLTYAYRGDKSFIKARISNDIGRTWGDEIILRDDARTYDIGYTRTVIRPDGRLLTVYYFSTLERLEQHIEATIWEV